LFNALYWYKNGQVQIFLSVLAIAFAITATALPAVLAPLYRIWMKFGHVVGRINAVILLTLLYFLIIVPTGIFMRTFRLSSTRFDHSSGEDSYWIDRENRFEKESMKRLF